MDKQEKIVCAAVKKWVGSEVSVELFVDYPRGVFDTVNGDCGREKGFITNKNRFVDAKEAMNIAVEAEQLEGFLNANYWDGFYSGRGDVEDECKNLSDEYLKRELKPSDLY